MSLLLTDGLQRKTLATARSVGSRGVSVGVGETTRWNPSAFSKFNSRSWVYPDPRSEPDQYHDSLLNQLSRGQYEVYFPMDDPTMELAMKRRDELERVCLVPLPPADSFRIASDKGEAALTAARAGIDAPRTALPESLDEVPNLAGQVGWPLVVKPRRSSGSRGIRLVRHEAELMPVYREIHEQYPFPALQQFIPTGRRFDVCLLYDADSRLRAAFTQQELRHYPEPMGPSTMQLSVWMPELVERAKAVMERLPWHGVVELEFMEDAVTGKPVFMEINTRFWGSLHLAVQSGVDFPWLLYQLVKRQPIEDTFTYRIGERCRTMLPGELLYFAANRNRLRMDPPLWAGRNRGGEDDILSWSDPMPTLGFMAACVRYMLDAGMWKRMIKR